MCDFFSNADKNGGSELRLQAADWKVQIPARAVTRKSSSLCKWYNIMKCSVFFSSVDFKRRQRLQLFETKCADPMCVLKPTLRKTYKRRNTGKTLSSPSASQISREISKPLRNSARY